MTKSHRFDPEDEYGVDQSNFPSGINHIVPHRVPPSPVTVHTVPGPMVPFVGGGASVFHGEPPTDASFHADPYELAEQQATLPTNYVRMPDQLAPIPVTVVPPEGGPEAFSDFRAVRVKVLAASPTGTELLGKDPKRSRLLIRNENTVAGDSVLVNSRRGDVENGSGYVIPAGMELEINAGSAVYAKTIGTANDVTVSVLAEFSVTA